MHNFVVRISQVLLCPKTLTHAVLTLSRMLFLMKEALDSLTEPVSNAGWQKVWLAMVT